LLQVHGAACQASMGRRRDASFQALRATPGHSRFRCVCDGNREARGCDGDREARRRRNAQPQRNAALRIACSSSMPAVERRESFAGPSTWGHQLQVLTLPRLALPLPLPPSCLTTGGTSSKGLRVRNVRRNCRWSSSWIFGVAGRCSSGCQGARRGA